MCGIAGHWTAPGASASELEEGAAAMAEAIRWRGPDDAGTWSDAVVGLGLGHRRLAVLDTSRTGHQPMASASGRFVVVYNGECYNFRDLRADLEATGVSFRGTGDTETLLAGFEAWGIEATLERMVGMFAFAAWDLQAQELVLARDRLGEKPLYYGVQGDAFLFGSQPGALRAHPAFEARVDRDALARYVARGYVPSPWCIYEGVRKLPPGTLLRVPLDRRLDPPAPTPYWDAEAVAREARGGATQVTDLEAALRSAVRGCLVSDVPVGVFLSGGIDSSLVAALAQEESAAPVRTFTLGFHAPGFDESDHAAAVADHLGTDHTQHYVTPEQAQKVIPDLPRVYDEPFADSSQIPTLLLSRLARDSVTVALSGDGGDELFGGYNRHVLLDTWWPRIERMPRTARRALAALLAAPRPGAWDALARVLPRSLRPGTPGVKAQKLAAVLAAPDLDDAYERLVRIWDPSVLADRATARFPALPADLPPAEAAMLHDARTYLPDDVLVKTDRAAMAVGLEGRAPLLDHRVFAAAWGLPTDARIRDGKGKAALRTLLARFVPPSLTERPKQGFAVPVGAWLRGPLRDWAEALLDEQRLRREGHFDAAVVRRAWDEHASGRRDRTHELWCVLMFQAWWEAQGEDAEPPNRRDA